MLLNKSFVFNQISFVVFIALLFDLIMYYAVLGYILLYKPPLNFLNIFLVIFFVFSAGCVLFIFKCKYPKWYGGFELVLAGLNVLAFLTSTTSDDEKAYATLFSHLATLYIIVRGLDNCFSKDQVLSFFSVRPDEKIIIPDFEKNMSKRNDKRV